MHVVVDGELDLGAAPQLEAVLEEVARASGPVLVDLSTPRSWVRAG